MAGVLDTIDNCHNSNDGIRGQRIDSQEARDLPTTHNWAERTAAHNHLKTQPGRRRFRDLRSHSPNIQIGRCNHWMSKRIGLEPISNRHSLVPTGPPPKRIGPHYISMSHLPKNNHPLVGASWDHDRGIRVESADKKLRSTARTSRSH